jgi:hypothetical protein
MHCNDTLAKIEARNAEARTIMVQYTGHVGEGGLQGHSVGALYPYIVYGQETPDGTRYGVQKADSNFDTGPRFACADAYTIAEFNANVMHGRALTDEFRAEFSRVVQAYSEPTTC